MGKSLFSKIYLYSLRGLIKLICQQTSSSVECDVGENEVLRETSSRAASRNKKDILMEGREGGSDTVDW